MSQSGSAAQFRQLPMFMTAQELKTEVTPGDFKASHYGVPQNVNDMWSKKYRESQTRPADPFVWDTPDQPRLSKSIKRDGVKNPVDVWHYDDEQILADGHHRVATAHAISPNYLIPVEHTERQRGPYAMEW